MGPISVWIVLLIVLIDVLVVAGLTYFITRYLNEQYRREQTNRADNILAIANENARTIELEAKDKALKFIQEGETEIMRRRQEVSREEERLTKRRADLDHRMERLEQREQTLNKRQSAIDRRLNEVDKAYSQQMVELQRIAQMTIDEARTVVLAEAEKEGRS